MRSRVNTFDPVKRHVYDKLCKIIANPANREQRRAARRARATLLQGRWGRTYVRIVGRKGSPHEVVLGTLKPIPETISDARNLFRQRNGQGARVSRTQVWIDTYFMIVYVDRAFWGKRPKADP